MMGATRNSAVVVGALFLAFSLAACGGGPRTSTPSTKATGTPGSASTARPGSTTSSSSTVPVGVSARAVVSPSSAFAGEAVMITVAIRGPGTASGEGVAFGDGQTTGANAGEVPCGQTARIDITHTWTHVFARPGTYQFRDDFEGIGPPPSCRSEQAQATATVTIRATVQTPSISGGFVSPTKNIACDIEPTAPQPVRCATFSPPQLANMAPDGSVSTCYGGQCELGNPGSGAPVLPYGSATSTGPYQCVSATSGMTCIVTGGTAGTGFLISRSGITSLQ